MRLFTWWYIRNFSPWRQQLGVAVKTNTWDGSVIFHEDGTECSRSAVVSIRLCFVKHWGTGVLCECIFISGWRCPCEKCLKEEESWLKVRILTIPSCRLITPFWWLHNLFKPWRSSESPQTQLTQKQSTTVEPHNESVTSFHRNWFITFGHAVFWRTTRASFGYAPFAQRMLRCSLLHSNMGQKKKDNKYPGSSKSYY